MKPEIKTIVPSKVDSLPFALYDKIGRPTKARDTTFGACYHVCSVLAWRDEGENDEGEINFLLAGHIRFCVDPNASCVPARPTK